MNDLTSLCREDKSAPWTLSVFLQLLSSVRPLYPVCLLSLQRDPQWREPRWCWGWMSWYHWSWSCWWAGRCWRRWVRRSWWGGSWFSSSQTQSALLLLHQELVPGPHCCYPWDTFLKLHSDFTIKLIKYGLLSAPDLDQRRRITWLSLSRLGRWEQLIFFSEAQRDIDCLDWDDEVQGVVSTVSDLRLSTSWDHNCNVHQCTVPLYCTLQTTVSSPSYSWIIMSYRSYSPSSLAYVTF